MPTVDVLNVRGTTLTASSLPELEHLLRRGFAPVSGTVAAARAAFGANYDAPAALETYQSDTLRAAFGGVLRPDPLAAPPGPRPSMLAQANTAGHGWTNAGTGSTVTSLNDTGDATFGSQCITMTTVGDNGTTRAAANYAFGAPQDFTGKHPVVWIKCDDLSRVKNIELRLGDATFAAFFYFELEPNTVFARANRFLRDGKWTRLAVPWGFINAAGNVGTPSRAAVSQVRVTVNDNGAGPAVVHLAGFGVQAEPSVAYCSFTFDDGWADQWNVARPTLDRYGWAATALPIVDLIGSGSSYMTLQQLRDLQDVQGWEIGAHAYTNAAHSQTGGFTALTDAQLDTELSSLKTWLLANGFRGRDYFAYPQGLHDDVTLAAVRNYFSAARTQIMHSRETLPVSDRFRTRTVNLGTGITLAQVQGWVDETVTNKEWINFTSHKLGASASDGSTWATADFQALCAYIAGKGSAIQVRPYGQVLRTVT